MTRSDRREGAWRLFAGLAALCATAGMAVWIALWWAGEAKSPARASAHALVMMGGFVFSLACATLARAGRPLPIGIIVGLAAGITTACSAALVDADRLARGLHLLTAGLALAAVLPRWRDLPGALPLAIAAAAAGNLLWLMADQRALPADALRAGDLLTHQTAALLLAIATLGAVPWPWLAGGTAALLAAVACEAGPWLADGDRLPAAWGLRALAFAMLALPRLPKGSGTRGLRWAAWMIALGLALAAIDPRHAIGWQHLAWVGGLFWLLLAAHAALAAPPRRWVVATWTSLVLLAAATRVSTEIWRGAHELHLALASMFAIAALALWVGVLRGPPRPV